MRIRPAVADWDQSDREADAALAENFPAFKYGGILKFTEVLCSPDTRSSDIKLQKLLKERGINSKTSSPLNHGDVDDGEKAENEVIGKQSSIQLGIDERDAFLQVRRDDVIYTRPKRKKEQTTKVQASEHDDFNAGVDNHAPLPVPSPSLKLDGFMASVDHKQDTEVCEFWEFKARRRRTSEDPLFALIETAQWEEKIMWDGNNNYAATTDQASVMSNKEALIENKSIFDFPNVELQEGVWVKDIIWSPGMISEKARNPPLIVDKNDAHMLFDDGVIKPQRKDRILKIPKRTGAKRIPEYRWNQMTYAEKTAAIMVDSGIKAPASMGSDDPFNLSNDHWYQLRGATNATVVSLRKSMGERVVEHSVPAMRLVRPFFQTIYTDYELRHFHRTPILPDASAALVDVMPVPVDEAPVQQKHVAVKSRRDLSAQDGTLILAEYCEEHPPLIMRTGMCTRTFNYFKRDEDSEQAVPSFEFGFMKLMNSMDDSPLLGKLAIGEFLQCFENNLFRAPIYKHVPQSTDFLLIRTNQQYFLRDIKSQFTVGQQCPKVVVPTPRSKAEESYIRNRVTSYILSLFRRKNHIRTQDVMKAFPNIGENYIRLRLRDVATFVRGGSMDGTWQYSGNVEDLDQEDIQNIMTPELVCAYESMLENQLRLRDAGYSLTESNTVEASESSIDSRVNQEARLASWNTTADFLSCIEGECLLAVTGPADPTGLAREGFSYLRMPLRPNVGSNSATDTLMPNLPEKLKTGKKSTRELVTSGKDTRKWEVETMRMRLKTEFGYDDNHPDLNPKQPRYRWVLHGLIKDLEAKRAAEEGEDEAATNSERSLLALHRRRFNNECQRIFDLQNKRLASEEVLSSDDDDEDDDPDIDDDLVDLSSACNRVNDSPSTAAAREAAAYQNFRANLHSIARDQTSSPSALVTDRRTPTNDATYANTALVIRRQFQSGEHQEVVSDPKVIKAYLRFKQGVSAAQNALRSEQADSLASKIEAQKARRRDLARVRRKKQLEKAHTEGTCSPARGRSPKNTTKLVCKNCGGIGHLRTNMACPKYEMYKNQREQSRTPPAVHSDGLNSTTFKSEVQEEVADAQFVGSPSGNSPTTGQMTQERQRRIARGRLNTLIGELLKTVSSEPSAQYFLTSVSKKIVPDYYDIIRRPMDLATMKARAAAMGYQSRQELLDDIRQLVANAALYNGMAHPVYQAACELRKCFLSHISTLTSELEELEVTLGTAQDLVEVDDEVENDRRMLEKLKHQL